MFWLRLLQFSGVILLIAFFVTQIIMPAILSRKLFPLFRKTEKELSAQYTELTQQLHEVDLKDKVEELNKRLNPTTPSETPAQPEQKSTDTTQS